MAESTKSRVRPPHAPQGWVPVPDPTELTRIGTETAKEDLRRELEALNDLFGKDVQALWRTINTNTTLIQAIPADTAAQIATMKELHQRVLETVDERLQALHAEVLLRHEHAKAAALEVKETMATTLVQTGRLADQQATAFREAAQKSEDSFTKQIAALDNKITLLADLVKATMTRDETQQLVRTVSDKIDGPTGLAMRFEALLARTTTTEDVSRRNTGNNQWLIGAILGAGGFLLALLGLALALLRGQPS